MVAFLQRLWLSSWFVPTAIVVLTMATYLPCLFVLPLADEQFLLAWTRAAGSSAYPVAKFLQFNGLFAADWWQIVTPLSLKLSFLSSLKVVWIWRLQNLVLHCLTALCLYFVTRGMAGSITGFFAALLFVVWPANVEAVAWLGGRGAILSGFFLVAALALYLRSRAVHQFAYGDWHMRAGWRYVIAAAIVYAAALLTVSTVWIMSFLFPLVEVLIWFQTPKDKRVNGTFSVIAPLIFLVLAAGVTAASGAVWGYYMQPHPAFSFKQLGIAFGAAFIPVSPANYAKTASAVRVYVCSIAPLLIVFAVALVRKRANVWLPIFSAAWFVVAVCPYVGYVEAVNHAGVHNLYLATMPLAIFFAAAIESLYQLFRRNPVLGQSLAAVAVCAMVTFCLTQCWKQVAEYNRGGRLQRSIERCLKLMQGNLLNPLVIIQHTPATTSVSKVFTDNPSAVFDLRTGLLCSRTFSGGRLKDALKTNSLSNAMVTWDSNFGTFINSSVASGAAQPTVELDAQKLLLLFTPPIAHNRLARFDEQANEIVLGSTSLTSGPLMRLSGDFLPPLAEDFLWIDAAIDTPKTAVNPQIELYFQSAVCPDFDFKNRRITTPVAVSDGAFHRYYLPLRSRSWIACGQSFALTFGFPAASTVRVRGLGTTSKDSLMAEFTVQDAGGHSVVHFPAFNFPSAPALGLIALPPDANAVPISFSCKQIAGAAGVLIEISLVDRDFEVENGAALSGVTYRTIAVDGLEGSYQIALNNFYQSGIYAIRAISMDRGHNIFGNFSDTWYVYVPRPKADWGAMQ